MKHLRPIALVLAVSACFVSLALAGGKGTKSAGSSDCCGAKAAKTTTAANSGSCAMHGATTAAASGSCASHGNSTAAASGCPMGGKSAMAAGNCAMHGTTAAGAKCDMAGATHGNCVVCTDETACDEEMRGLNSHAQVVELRNGLMIVYTADTPENVRALQVSLARHNEQVVTALKTNSDASLCGACKSFRGAMASGKFSRELVKVKTGAQVLLTSNDPAVVQRIHDLAGAPMARTKS